MKIFALLLVFITAALPCALRADMASPVFYSRTSIAIARKKLPVLPWQTAAEPGSAATGFDVEVRDASVIYQQQGWFNLSSLEENSGILLLFNAPTIAPISPSTQYAPLDILMIDPEGKIIQIAPGIRLSELKEDIYPVRPVLAFLFLKGGSCAQRSINLGDEVEYNVFKKPPTVLGGASLSAAGTIVPALSPPTAQSPTVQATPVVNVSVQDTTPHKKPEAKRVPASNPLPTLIDLPDSPAPAPAPVPAPAGDALQSILDQGNPTEKPNAESTAVLDKALKK